MDHHSPTPPRLVLPLAIAALPPCAGIWAMIAAEWADGPFLAVSLFQIALYGLIGFAVAVQRQANWQRRLDRIEAPTFGQCPTCARWRPSRGQASADHRSSGSTAW